MTPKRIQRKRTKGWKMPEGAVYVGRPTKWGNPYKIPEHSDTAMGAVISFRFYICGRTDTVPLRKAAIAELRGKDLACWCPLDQPCHADVLLEIANSEGRGKRVSAMGKAFYLQSCGTK